MRKFHLLSLAILATLTATPALAAKAPHMPIARFNDLAQPLPKPYDEAADAKATDAAVAAARARAKKAGKLLLVDLGGNWCLDCRILAGVMETAPLRQWVAARYEIVTVDVGRFNKNLQVPARYGITDRLEGVPALLIVNPRTGKLVNAGRVTALADARSMSPQGLADWLAQWPAK
ncbi:thioredoxin family protein [Novosphingobium cyanobacteriorum]|uniref:Thioredoxin family protein n=1 Tax=Novosphingobium cyanobacteriorum TaxID=3024215 RepID=A0ABT6CG87_9SPHN|nr:thioredoxin family protein [Novosphingobium cyanobacteriorum]MDF8332524.1 thioredoxin family protein [Novosphingobium cyanobacteriorum]